MFGQSVLFCFCVVMLFGVSLPLIVMVMLPGCGTSAYVRRRREE